MHLSLLPLFILLLAGCHQERVKIENPVINGYYADPSIVLHDGHYYIYATKAPWGGDDLAVFETSDFQKNGQYYILYHKIFPQKDDYVLRQLCIDSLNFDAENNIEKITSNGVVF